LSLFRRSPILFIRLTARGFAPMVARVATIAREGRAMTITPRPDQAQLIAEAIRAGLIKSEDEALDIAVDTLRGRLKTSVPPLNADEWKRMLHDWIHSHSTMTPLLSDEAISRESIYRERGL